LFTGGDQYKRSKSKKQMKVNLQEACYFSGELLDYNGYMVATILLVRLSLVGVAGIACGTRSFRTVKFILIAINFIEHKRGGAKCLHLFVFYLGFN